MVWNIPKEGLRMTFAQLGEIGKIILVAVVVVVAIAFLLAKDVL